MNRLFPFAFLLILTVFAQAQSASNSTDQLEELANTIEEEARQLKTQLEQEKTRYYFHKELNIEFHIDTFKIEQKHSRSIELNYSTMAMVGATGVALDEYDQLLNKYYKKLLQRLDETDQEVLRKTQRSWITQRENDIELIRLLKKPEYSGGGTIQRIISAERILSLTKSRVLLLFEYLVETME